MSLKSTTSTSFLGNLKKCITFASFPVISLVIYMGLRSTQIFPEGGTGIDQLWHPAYMGWYDFLLGCSIVFSLASGLIKLDKGTFVFILTLSIIISLSFFNALELGSDYVLDTLVNLFRFSLTFSLAKGLVHRLGTQTTESLLILLFIILAISSLFVFRLQFGIFNRIYAAGMTAASFAQVAAVVCFIAILRKYNIILLLSLVFLLLTFSRTSILAFVVLFFICSRNMPIYSNLKYYILIGFSTFSFIFVLLNFTGDAFEDVIASRANSEEFSNLNSRKEIWEYALYLLRSEYIPLFGIGFNATPYLIRITNFRSIDPEGVRSFIAHFHSIFIEYAFGLGILSLFIFYYMFKRVSQTFQHNCYPSFFIFAFFLITQSVDFVFYRPKEIIIWSLILGLAEGQWRFERE